MRDAFHSRTALSVGAHSHPQEHPNGRARYDQISGARSNRRLGAFNGRKAWLFVVDDDLLRELVDGWKASEATRLAVLQLVNRKPV